MEHVDIDEGEDDNPGEEAGEGVDLEEPDG
jgi:hypothetical protein